MGNEREAQQARPHAIQRDALAALERTREEGFTAGLVVLATGLGKTWLAAFDSNRNEYDRILFIAHREEILEQGAATFQRVRPTASIGRLIGEHREIDADLVFASVQTLARLPHLSRFQPDDFDYIVVDEFHHASAPTYRRIIDHFRPKFLLGLTATPDRTDGADLLTLCQENLVFQANVRHGIESGHLCPFHYFGVPDHVEYSNIPWRNAQFDITELTALVATEARALNALEQLRKHGGRRCIAFCCSQRHADFMASFFVSKGLRAVAVHSGSNSAPRTSSLENLRRGALDVIFAVDMFNEGVDLPSIDTVLMLRPTESAIVWLQQLGRGLRVSADKRHLIVIDYIGNHRAFLTKLQGIAAVVGHSAESSGRQRELLQAIRDEQLDLPAGCDVTYETEVLNILEHLVRPTRVESELESFYRGFEERNGARPTAVETFHAGLNPRSNSDRSWLAFVERMGGLTKAENATWAMSREFFTFLEKVEYAASHELVLLLSMFEAEAVVKTLSVDALSQKVIRLVRRVHGLANDFSGHYNPSDVQSLLVGRPIESWVEARSSSGAPYFEFDGDEFAFAFSIPDVFSFGALLRELLDWRLSQYLARPPAALEDSPSNSGARLWERYPREEIPPAFGLRFSTAIWNAGFIANEPNVFLLVTLAKDGMTANFHYSDHFISDREFNWQSQNRTKQDSKHGQLIRDHRLKGARIHLFVRPTKKTGSKPTPFTYCGEVDFVSWQGDQPITVRWRLREPVPAALHSSLKVPG